MGGTQFADTVNPDLYWRSTNRSGFLSALGYIPEGAWNEPLDGKGNPQAAATGGGVSKFIPTPPWQTGLGSPGHAGALYAGRVAQRIASRRILQLPCRSRAGLVRDSSGHFLFMYSYGTSAAAPSMAGIAALLNHKMGGASGQSESAPVRIGGHTRQRRIPRRRRRTPAASSDATCRCRACATTARPGRRPERRFGGIPGRTRIRLGHGTRLDRCRQSVREVGRGARLGQLSGAMVERAGELRNRAGASTSRTRATRFSPPGSPTTRRARAGGS